MASVVNRQDQSCPVQVRAVSSKNTRLSGVYFGNINAWLLIGAALSVYFTAGKGIPLLLDPSTGPWFFTHLATAMLVSWLCFWNLVYTPFHGGCHRVSHVYSGRLSIAVGVISFLTGLATTWYERYDGINPFSVGISIGGFLQVRAQYIGYWSLQGGKKNIGRHIKAHRVFFGGCLIPAFMRVPVMFGFHHVVGDFWYAYCWAFAIGLEHLSAAAANRKTWF